MTRPVKLLFSGIAVALAAVGLPAIVTRSHTGYARYEGIRTLQGPDAVWFGETCLILALMPLVVWLPPRMVKPALIAWGCVLIGWLSTLYAG